MNRPKLILLVGPPGCGKTTFCKQYIEKTNPFAVHLSSDSIRKELWGDESIQGDNNQVFSLMQNRAIEALNNGKDVLYDATNMTRKDRSYIISLCPKFVKIEAHIIWAPIEDCINRDASRERTVGKEVIDKMLKRFQAPYYDEGIDSIYIAYPNNFDHKTYAHSVFNSTKIPHDNPHHSLDVYEHCCAAARYMEERTGEWGLMTAALLHDIGKPYTKSFQDAKGNPCDQAHYYQHQCVGAWQYYGMRAMHMGLYDIDVAWLISTHMEPFFNSKYYKSLPAYLKEKIDLLHEADKNAH